MMQHSGNLVEVMVLQITWSARISSNVDLWPFGLLLFFYSTRRHEVFQTGSSIMLLMWEKKSALSVGKRASGHSVASIMA